MRSTTLGRALLVGATAAGLALVGGVTGASAASACDINCTIEEAGTYQEERVIIFVPAQNNEE